MLQTSEGLSSAELAVTLKNFVEQPDAVEPLLELERVLALTDADTLSQVVMAFGSNFVKAGDEADQRRLETVMRVLPNDNVAHGLEEYIETSSGFLAYYRRPNAAKFREEEMKVEDAFDQVARSFEATLAQADIYTLIMVVVSLGNNFGDVSTPQGQSRLRDALKYFSDFEDISTELESEQLA